AAFIWATIQRLYAARNSGLKKEMFGYVRGGYARVLQRFGEVLREKGVGVRLNSKVEKIEKLKSNKVKVFAADGTDSTEKFKGKMKINSFPSLSEISVLAAPSAADSSAFEFDSVILTCPASIAAKICPQFSETEKAKLENVKYQGIVCASVLMKNSLSDFYVTNITDETPFTGIIEMSALVDKTEFGGNALVYLPKYVAPDDELFEKSDAEIEETFLAALEKMYARFDRRDVLAFKVSRVRQVFPIPTLDYSKNLPGVKTSLENVFVINSAHIVNGTLNVNETVQLAENFMSEHLNKE
ncbi:MAG TPA: FAD-dependent oxidoreductase, partial [Pyrinomonadaceae bacterium]